MPWVDFDKREIHYCCCLKVSHKHECVLSHLPIDERGLRHQLQSSVHVCVPSLGSATADPQCQTHGRKMQHFWKRLLSLYFFLPFFRSPGRADLPRQSWFLWDLVNTFIQLCLSAIFCLLPSDRSFKHMQPASRSSFSLAGLFYITGVINRETHRLKHFLPALSAELSSQDAAFDFDLGSLHVKCWQCCRWESDNLWLHLQVCSCNRSSNKDLRKDWKLLLENCNWAVVPEKPTRRFRIQIIQIEKATKIF